MAKKKESQECTVADLEYAVIFTFFFPKCGLSGNRRARNWVQ